MSKHIDEYLSKADWRVKENSNTVFSIGGLKNLLAETEMAKSALNRIPKYASSAHINHLMHIHDLGNHYMVYCVGWSVKDILMKGLGVDTRFISSEPAKHFDTALEHLLNHCFLLTQEASGAMAYSSVDVYLSPFIKEDKLTYHEVKQQVQRLVFNLSQKYRTGLQSPFSNLTLDLTPLGDMKNTNVIVGGKELEYTYKDCQKEIDMFNKAFCEVMSEGDSHGKPFSFPIPTYSITKEFDWEGETAQMLFDMASKTGIPYFSNFVNSEMNPDDVRSMCCRLRLDKRELINNGGGLFGAGEKTGSIGVVTLNLPRLAYMAKNPDSDKVEEVLEGVKKRTVAKFHECTTAEERFFLLIEYTMEQAKTVLVRKRELLEELLSKGVYPYTKVYLDDYSNHFNTLGVIGMNEALLNLKYKKGILNPSGKKLAEDVLDFMLDKLRDFQEEFADFYVENGINKGLLFNLEATPGEGSGYKLAKYDKEYFEGKNITSNGLKGVDPYYTNSTMIPVDDPINENIFDVLDNQDSLQTKYTSGTVLHVYTVGKLTWEKGRDIIKKAFNNYHLPYMSLSPTITVCPKHGRLDGVYEYCPLEHTQEDLDYIEKMGGIVVYTSQKERKNG